MEKTTKQCPECLVLYTSHFYPLVIIKSIHNRNGRFVVAGYGKDFDNEPSLHDGMLMRVVADDMIPFKSFCSQCVRNHISRGDIIEEYISQSCYKCNTRFKDYEDLKYRITANHLTNIYIVNDKGIIFYDRKVYRMDEDDSKLVKFKDDELIKSWPLDQQKWYESWNEPRIWICKSCFSMEKEFDKIYEYINIPTDLCNIVHSYLLHLRNYGTVLDFY